MSGLFARAKPAGQDGVRYARSKHMGDIEECRCNLRKLARIRPIGHSIYCVLQVRGPSAEQPRSSAAIADQAGMAIRALLYSAPPPSGARQCGRTCWRAPPPPASAAFVVAALSWEQSQPVGAIFVRKQPKSHGTALMIEGLDD